MYFGFIDDSLLSGSTQSECRHTFEETKSLMQNLGFMINYEKSVTEPNTKICYLGNVIDSVNMIVLLPDDKKDRIASECRKLYFMNTATIRFVAQIIGLIVSSFSAVDYAKLHYRCLERAKIHALKSSKGNFDCSMPIESDMKLELRWWFENIHSQVRQIERGNPEICISTDASLSGWGAVCDGNKIGGRWTIHENQSHINELELQAILLALRSFIVKINGKHVKILSDSSTAVSYVTNMGGTRSVACDKIARNIWFYCIEHGVWLTCIHVAGCDNEADEPSRNFNDRIEWSLDQSIFDSVCCRFGTPTIDLFATRLNTKLPDYCAWKCEPHAQFVDAFSLSWKNFHHCYIFPPFSLLTRCVRKIKQDQARATIIAPIWPTQVWFSPLMKLLVQHPVILPKGNILSLPHNTENHPLQSKLVLMACKTSGLCTETRVFQDKLPVSSCRHGDSLHNVNTSVIFQDGLNIVINNKSLDFEFL